MDELEEYLEWIYDGVRMGDEVLGSVEKWIKEGDLMQAAIGVANVQVLLNRLLDGPDAKMELGSEDENYLMALSKTRGASKESMDWVGAMARTAKKFFGDSDGAFREGNLPLVFACLINARFVVNTLIDPPPEAWLNVNRS